MISTLPKKGHLLIAEPSILGDVSFNRSVVLLAEHNSEGSIGFILNKPLSYNINDLMSSCWLCLGLAFCGCVLLRVGWMGFLWWAVLRSFLGLFDVGASSGFRPFCCLFLDDPVLVEELI